MRAGLLLLAGLSLASAGTQRQRRQLKSDKQLSRRQSSSKYAVYTLDQPIDHFPTEDRYQPHTNATFKQRYTFDASYYQPGGPVYLYVGGETSLESRLSNLETGIIQILMNATGGLGVIIENRYYGDSVPYANLTTDNLAYLTNEQTIADFAYFAQHATFPGVADNASLAAPAAPWIMYGGSLAGAQTSFTVKTYPDLIYGGIAASGVTHVAVEYPEWYDPIQKFAPQDCVASINGVVDKFDALVAANNSAAVAEVKAVFGLEALADDRDFAKTIAYPLGGPFDYPTETWQELIWTDQQAQFWEFCTAVTDLDAPANVTAVDTQLAKYSNGTAWENLGNYANYIKEVILPTCPSGNYAGGECFGAGNGTFWLALHSSLSSSISFLFFFFSLFLFLLKHQRLTANQPPHSHVVDRARRRRDARLPLHDVHRGRPLPGRPPGRALAHLARHGRRLHPAAVRRRLPARPLQRHPRLPRRRPLERVWGLRRPGRPPRLHRREPRPVARRLLPLQRGAAAPGHRPAARAPHRLGRPPLGQHGHPRRRRRAAVHPRVAPLGDPDGEEVAEGFLLVGASSGGGQAVRRRTWAM